MTARFLHCSNHAQRPEPSSAQALQPLRWRWRTTACRAWAAALTCGVLALAPSSTSAAEVTIAGASTMLPLLRDATAHFATYENFVARLRGGSSEDGIDLLLRGETDLAMVARPLSETEQKQLRAHHLANDGIALIVHQRNPLQALTRDSIQKLFSGQISDWQELAAAAPMKGRIVPVVKAQNRSLRQLFDHYFSVSHLIRPGTVEIGSNTAVLLYVAADPQAIGYLSIGALQQAKARHMAIHEISIDGQLPSPLSCRQAQAPLCFPLMLVSRINPPPHLQRFIQFFDSPPGRDLLLRHGLSLPP